MRRIGWKSWLLAGAVTITGGTLGLGLPNAAATSEPTARAAATCADHPNQAAAQRAADTRDADGDGVYCESLPCPCAGAGDKSGDTPKRAPAPRKRTSCTKPRKVQNITFSKT